jgi:FMN phosphatase YigB (HAD superfamily)
MTVKAVLFDLYETLVYSKKSVTDEEVSEYLCVKGYEVSPQQFRAAHMFVSFMDDPKYGYKNWGALLKRVLWRLKVEADKQTLNGLAKTMERNEFALYPDAAVAVKKANELGLKTAIVTTISRFRFQAAVAPLEGNFDFIMTGYEAKCDKSNPKMYKMLLQVLNVKPYESVVVGDDMKIDILLPKKLGMKTILLDRESQNPTTNTAPDATAKNLIEAMEIVEKRWLSI